MRLSRLADYAIVLMTHMAQNPEASHAAADSAAATRLRNIEGYSHQREKLISLGTMAAAQIEERLRDGLEGRKLAHPLQMETGRQAVWGGGAAAGVVAPHRPVTRRRRDGEGRKRGQDQEQTSLAGGHGGSSLVARLVIQA